MAETFPKLKNNIKAQSLKNARNPSNTDAKKNHIWTHCNKIAETKDKQKILKQTGKPKKTHYLFCQIHTF